MIPRLWRWRQEDWKFILGYIVSMRYRRLCLKIIREIGRERGGE